MTIDTFTGYSIGICDDRKCPSQACEQPQLGESQSCAQRLAHVPRFDQVAEGLSTRNICGAHGGMASVEV